MSEVIAYAGTKSVVQLSDQRGLVRQVLDQQMKAEVHYGVIPGTDKPSLYKAGAEMLLSVFNVALMPEIVDLSTDDAVTYRVKARGIHIGTGAVIGEGVGECSTNEDKYKWRGAGPREWAATPEVRRRTKYTLHRGSGQEYETQQVRTNPADLANTVLKMAKKRAEVDLCLTALAVSDMFTQDAEDLVDPETGEVTRRAPPPKYGTAKPKPSSAPAAGNGVATEKQQNLVRVKLDQAGIEVERFCAQFGIGALVELKFAQVNPALEWIRTAGKTESDNQPRTADEKH